ncbi:sodium-dependent phosphate transport protein 3-like isoform X2 [Uloborus diversus]|uniref:sodium-dependent phosphate transport protein 3-like isoform X2 n=1 Tax=Uloborus diversus TaxID=327109 RepID=UPI00240A048F|nr:sodium-dependent phosphate transport protein 3-like isoform X2 [Uloborus diversus]
MEKIMGLPARATKTQATKYNWSPKIQGGILGAGFFGYVLFLIAGGKLAETFGPKIVLIIGTFLSSFSTMVTPFTANVSPYFVMFIQCVRGIAQGCMFPSMTVLSANWFPKPERGLLSGLALSGYILGLLLVGILSSIMCDSVAIGGWPSVFYVFGGFGIFISILQLLFLTNMPEDDPRISSAELKYILDNQENKLTTKRPAVPWRRILSSMPTYALFLGAFGKYWLCIHFLSVHPTFLATVLHFPMKQNGVLVSVPHVLSMLCNVVSSVLSSFLSSKNYLSISILRKFWHLLGCLLYSLCLVAMIVSNSDSTVTITCTIIGISVFGFANSGIMIVPLDMTPTFAGSLNALNASIGSVAGFILPMVCGALTNEEQTVQQWNKFFILSIVIAMSTAIFFCVFGSSEVQSYNFAAEDVSPRTEERKNDSKAVESKDTS